jgi:hypothetical protein
MILINCSVTGITEDDTSAVRLVRYKILNSFANTRQKSKVCVIQGD